MNGSEPGHIAWRISSYSTNGGNCVEAGRGGAEVLVRDTKDRTGGMLSVSEAAWSALLRAQRAS